MGKLHDTDLSSIKLMIQTVEANRPVIDDQPTSFQDMFNDPKPVPNVIVIPVRYLILSALLVIGFVIWRLL